MNRNCESRYKSCAMVVIFAAFAILMTACNSGTHEKESVKKASTEQTQQGRAGNAVIGADYCLQTFMKGPPNALPAPVHLAYKTNSSDGVSKDFESDVAANTMDLTFTTRQPATPDMQGTNYKIHDGVADWTNTLHYTRADEHEWASAPTMPVQGATPWAEFINKPPIDLVGPDTVNGFQTVKYSVDTSKESQADRVGFTGIKDYNLTGTVWLTKDTGCILQWVMDAQTTHKDDTITKVHYEGTATKK